MDRGRDREYLLEPAKSLFIYDNLEDEEAEMQEFDQVGLNLNCVGGSRYLGDYLGPREELEAWVRPKVEAWAHGVRTLAKISK